MGKFEHFFIGTGRWPIVVIDDFHQDPMTLVNNAGDISRFELYKNDFYPGVKQSLDDDSYATNIARYADDFSRMLGIVLGTVGGLQASVYAIANSLPSELLPIQRIPHYDTARQQQFALVHYLCAPEWGGTAFYRHRSTNIERIDGQSERVFQQALGREATTYGLPPAEYVNGDTPLFEQIGMVDAKFNRAVIYPASLLHSGHIRLHRLSHKQMATGQLSASKISTSKLSAMRLTITSQVNIESAP
ncbi:MAG: hypothetical protein ACJAYF_000166 [Arenicella sp.]